MTEKRSPNPKDLLGILKPPMSLVPSTAVIWEAMAMKFGAYGINARGEQVRPKGYGKFNWREHPVLASVYIDALERHIARVKDEGCAVVAADSLVLDLAHARACLGILIDALESGNLIDDLNREGPAGRLLDRLTLKPKEPTSHGPQAPIINADDPAGSRLGCLPCQLEEPAEGRSSDLQAGGGSEGQGVIPAAEFGRPHRP